MANNRLPVYLLPSKPSDSLPDLPPHRTSPKFAALLVNVSWAKYVKPSQPKLGIVLLGRFAWAEVKEQFRAGPRPVPKLLPPRRPENLDLSYPEAYRQSNGAAIRRQVWAANLQAEPA
jgi:hypothetical protein